MHTCIGERLSENAHGIEMDLGCVRIVERCRMWVVGGGVEGERGGGLTAEGERFAVGVRM